MLAAIVENSAGRWPSVGSARGLRHTIGHTQANRLALWGVVAVVRHVVHWCGHVLKAERWPVVVRGVCDSGRSAAQIFHSAHLRAPLFFSFRPHPATFD